MALFHKERESDCKTHYIHIYIEREREGGGSVKRVAVKFEKSEVKL